MKKLAVSIIVAFAFSMVAAVAQTGTDPSQGTTGSSPGASQSGAPSQQQPGYSQTDPAAGQAAGQTTGQTNNTGTAAPEKGEKQLRGCVQSKGGQFVLESKKGKAVTLTGQDVSAHVGHEVAVKGNWESGSAGTGVSTAGSAGSEKTFNVTSVDMISDSCSGKSSKGNSGNMGASPSSSNPSNSNPSGTGTPPQ